MQKMKIIIYRIVLLFVCLLFESCSLLTDVNISTHLLNSDELSSKVLESKKFGFFPTYLNLERSVIGDSDQELSDEDIRRVNCLAETPDKAINSISKEEDGKLQLDLLSVLLSDNSTVQDVISSMEKIDINMAQAYQDALSIEYASMMSMNRNVFTDVSSELDFKTIKLKTKPFSESSRGILESNLNWDTIVWYTGYCATAMAGLVMYKASPWFKPWVKAIGIGIAAGGTALMGSQLTIWLTSNQEIKDLSYIIKHSVNIITEIKNQSTKDGAVEKIKNYLYKNVGASQSLQKIILGLVEEFQNPYKELSKCIELLYSKFNNDTEFSKKLLTILSSSAIPVSFCAICCKPLINVVKNTVIAKWNSIYAIITAPFGNATVKINLFGVILKPL